MNIFTLLSLCAIITSSLACSCIQQTTKDAYCGAEWVSHVKIKQRAIKHPMPWDGSRDTNIIRYAVEHIRVFKKPSSFYRLPNAAYTPLESATCGITLDVGKEYLLAGRVAPKRTLNTILCGQILPDPGENTFGIVMEWKQVPPALLAKIETIKC